MRQRKKGEKGKNMKRKEVKKKRRIEGNTEVSSVEMEKR